MATFFRKFIKATASKRSVHSHIDTKHSDSDCTLPDLEEPLRAKRKCTAPPESSTASVRDRPEVIELDCIESTESTVSPSGPSFAAIPEVILLDDSDDDTVIADQDATTSEETPTPARGLSGAAGADALQDYACIIDITISEDETDSDDPAFETVPRNTGTPSAREAKAATPDVNAFEDPKLNVPAFVFLERLPANCPDQLSVTQAVSRKRKHSDLTRSVPRRNPQRPGKPVRSTVTSRKPVKRQPKPGELKAAETALLNIKSDLTEYDPSGKPIREKSDFDFDYAPHTSKRLHTEKRPVMKMCKALTDICQHHRLIKNDAGLVSLENDNVARYCYDMGVVIRSCGRDLMIKAQNLQFEITTLRQDEVMQIKQELPGEGPSNASRPGTSRTKRSKVLKKKHPPQTAEEVLRRKCICQLCGTSYVHQTDLEAHLNRHADYQLLCGLCGKGFYSTVQLHLHEKIHEKGYFCCSICQREYESRSSLLAHFKSHNQKPYVCTIPGCSKSYTTKDNWVNHVKFGHLEERTFECDICGGFYKSPGVLSSHVSRDHKV